MELREDWKKIADTIRDYVPRRPRNSLEEMLAILAVAERVDPRFDLLLSVGAELRLGQVRRSMRSDLNLDSETLRVHGAGKKKGTVIEFTPGHAAAVRRALAGYLRDPEAARQAGDLEDYPLFPGGQLPGVRTWRAAQRSAPRRTRGGILRP